MVRLENLSSKHTEFLLYWQAIQSRFESELTHWIPTFFCDLPPKQVNAVRQILADGKRIRGCLVCLVNDALGGKIEDAIPRAVAIECVQAASLIHDDYVDEDTRRRNRPATWTVEGPRRAVLLGDLIFAVALKKMMEISRSDGLAAVHAIATMASGAYQETLGPSDLGLAVTAGRYSAEIYDRIIYLKTGALFGTAAKVGAIAAGASSAARTRAFEWGVYVGEAYQIADDLEEVLTFDVRPEDLRKRVSRVAPLFFYFAGNTNIDASPLSVGGEAEFCEWFRQVRPVLERRMRDAMAVRLDRAAKVAQDFSEAHDTRMVFAAPSAIVRMGEQNSPL